MSPACPGCLDSTSSIMDEYGSKTLDDELSPLTKEQIRPCARWRGATAMDLSELVTEYDYIGPYATVEGSVLWP